MTGWQACLKADPIPWLLEPENPSVRYWTLTELLDRPADDPEVRGARAAIPRQPLVQELFARQHAAGHWGDEAVGKVLKVAGRNGNPEAALEAVLQVPVDSLVSEWHHSILDMYSTAAGIGVAEPAREAGAARAGAEEVPEDEITPADEEFEPLKGESLAKVFVAQHPGARQLISKRTGSGTLNVGPSLSPDGRRLVFLSEKELFSIEMFLADAETGKILRRLTKTATDPHFDRNETACISLRSRPLIRMLPEVGS